ncbi:hypothetical protein ACWCPF_26065 [Streptomyces sp. NPDC001858]
MTPQTKARYSTAAATLFAAAGIYAGATHPALGAPGAVAAIALYLVARSYRREHWQAAVDCEQARRVAIVIPDPAPMPDWEQLAEQARYDETFGDMISHWNEDAA